VGSLRAITDTTGTVIKQIDYDSFGNVITDTLTTMAVPFGFAGGLHDHDTGLVRFGFRDYDPSIGRWTAKDPIDFAGGDVNLFRYVQSDPVNFVDPDGKKWIRNRSDKTWRYKPEGSSEIKFCPPGAKCDVDGLYTPVDTPSSEKRIIKIPDNCKARINPDGRVEFQCAGTKNLPAPNVCPVGRDFLDDHKDWPDPYSGHKWPYEKWD
jgi:RHS repeat-associated protein